MTSGGPDVTNPPVATAGPLTGLTGWSSRFWSSRTLRVSASTVVIVYVFLLFCIPSQLVVRPIGAPGTPANLWGIMALMWWLLATVAGMNPVKGMTPLRISLGLLTLAVLLSYVSGNVSGWYSPADIHQSTDQVYGLITVSVEELNSKMISAADRGLLSFAGWAGIVLLTSEGLRSFAELRRLVNWIVGLGTFVAVLGIFQYFTAYDIAALFQVPGLSPNSDFGFVDTRSILNRVSSTAVHPIEFGVLMAIVFLLALHRSVYNQSDSRTIRWLPTVVIGLALPMSVSRSAILAVAIGVLLTFAGWPSRWRWYAAIITPFAIVGVRLMAPGLVGTIRSLFLNLGNDPSISGRTDDYGSVFLLFLDHPILGRGLFTFVPRYYRVVDNQILLTLVELGIFGLIALVALLVTSFLLARAARRRAISDSEKHLALILSGSIVGVSVGYVTFDAWGFPMVAGMTFLLIGMAGAAHRLSLPDASALGLERV